MKKRFVLALFFMLSFIPAVCAGVKLEGTEDSLQLFSEGLADYNRYTASGAQRGLLSMRLSHLQRGDVETGYQHLYFIELGKPGAGHDRLIVLPPPSPAGMVDLLFGNVVFPEIRMYQSGRLLAGTELKKTVRMRSYTSLFQLPLDVVRNIQQADEVCIVMPMTDRSRQIVKVPAEVLEEWRKILNDDNILFAFINTRKERQENGVWGVRRDAAEADFAKTWRPLARDI